MVERATGSISRWAEGCRKPGTDWLERTLEKIMNILHMAPTWMIGRTPKWPAPPVGRLILIGAEGRICSQGSHSVLTSSFRRLRVRHLVSFVNSLREGFLCFFSCSARANGQDDCPIGSDTRALVGHQCGVGLLASTYGLCTTHKNDVAPNYAPQPATTTASTRRSTRRQSRAVFNRKLIYCYRTTYHRRTAQYTYGDTHRNPERAHL